MPFGLRNELKLRSSWGKKPVSRIANFGFASLGLARRWRSTMVQTGGKRMAFRPQFPSFTWGTGGAPWDATWEPVWTESAGGGLAGPEADAGAAPRPSFQCQL